MVIIPLPPEKIREVIGSGGKTIRDIVERSGAQVDIEDDGNAYVMASNLESMERAVSMINSIIRDIEVGEIFNGKVLRIMESGAIVELSSNKDGYLHISELDHSRVQNVEDVVKVGDLVQVKVIEVDREKGRVRLSRKALIERPAGSPEHHGDGGGERREHREHRGDRDRDRGGDRDRNRRPRPPRHD
jgi:polyribonucleotide nucleotidyltransferase